MQQDVAAAENYQSEADLERELIEDLVNQGYEFLSELNTPDALLANDVRTQLQTLNNVELADDEWLRFVEVYLAVSSKIWILRLIEVWNCEA